MKTSDAMAAHLFAPQEFVAAGRQLYKAEGKPAATAKAKFRGSGEDIRIKRRAATPIAVVSGLEDGFVRTHPEGCGRPAPSGGGRQNAQEADGVGRCRNQASQAWTDMASDGRSRAQGRARRLRRSKRHDIRRGYRQRLATRARRRARDRARMHPRRLHRLQRARTWIRRAQRKPRRSACSGSRTMARMSGANCKPMCLRGRSYFPASLRAANVRRPGADGVRTSPNSSICRCRSCASKSWM